MLTGRSAASTGIGQLDMRRCASWRKDAVQLRHPVEMGAALEERNVKMEFGFQSIQPVP